MKESQRIEQQPSFTESYLTTAGFPSPRSYDSRPAYLRAIEEWVREATSIMIESSKEKRSSYQNGG
ncbi:MAG: hypothetical protein ACE5OZ_04705 [Candidatus Heimdallarchaeota archaeon]